MSHQCPVLAERDKAAKELQHMQSILNAVQSQLLMSQQEGIQLASTLNTKDQDIQQGKIKADAIAAQAALDARRAVTARNEDRSYADQYVQQLRVEMTNIQDKAENYEHQASMAARQRAERFLGRP